MKVAMICTGGLSTNWIVKRIDEYAKDHQLDVELKAYGLADYYPAIKEADAVLLGPQIGYYQKEIQEKLGHEIGVISSASYAKADAAEILAQAATLASQK